MVNLKLKTDKPVVIIAGGGYGGVSAAQRLDQSKKFNVVLIDRKDYFLHNIGALRAVSDEGFVSKITIPYTNCFKNGGIFVQGEIEKITEENLKIYGWEDELKFDYLIISLGTSYAFPAKIATHEKKDVPILYEELREKVKKAEKIMIVGGGPVGIELSGDLKHFFPEKNITIVHGNEQLLNRYNYLKDKFISDVVKDMEKLDIKMKLNCRIDLKKYINGDQSKSAGTRYVSFPEKENIKLSDGSMETDVDLLILSNGSKLNNKALQAGMEKFLNKDNGRLLVNDLLQVKETKNENIFAIGDIADISKQMAYLAMEQGDHVAGNILLHHKKKQMKPYKIDPSPAMFLPIGPKYGVAQIYSKTPLFSRKVLGRKVVSMVKGRNLMYQQFWDQLNIRPKEAGNLKEVKDASEENVKILKEILECTEEQAVDILTYNIPKRFPKDDEEFV